MNYYDLAPLSDKAELLIARAKIERLNAVVKEQDELLKAVYVSDEDNHLYIQHMDADEWDARKIAVEASDE